MSALHRIRLPLCFAALAFALLLPAPAAATDFPTRKVTVVGTAIIKVVPDEMNWVVQIAIADTTSAKAKARHDTSLADALKFIKSLGGSVKDLQTGNLSIWHSSNDADPRTAAAKFPFNYSTQITFTLTEFDKYSSIADSLAKLDGIQVQSVDYASSKEAEVRRDALKRALMDAHDKASDLAVTGGCYIDKPYEINEQEASNIRPEMFNDSRYSSQGGGTPAVVAGQIEITAKVTATYDMFYK